MRFYVDLNICNVDAVCVRPIALPVLLSGLSCRGSVTTASRVSCLSLGRQVWLSGGAVWKLSCVGVMSVYTTLYYE